MQEKDTWKTKTWNDIKNLKSERNMNLKVIKNKNTISSHNKRF